MGHVPERRNICWYLIFIMICLNKISGMWVGLKVAGKAEIPNKKGKQQQDFSCVPLSSAPIERLFVGYCNAQVMSPVLTSQLEVVNTQI